VAKIFRDLWTCNFKRELRAEVEKLNSSKVHLRIRSRGFFILCKQISDNVVKIEIDGSAFSTIAEFLPCSNNLGDRTV